MSIINKNLIIVSDYVETSRFVAEIVAPFDVLALTPIAMLSLDNLNIPYKVTDNFYNTEEFKKDIYRIIDEAEIVLNKLDKYCQDIFHLKKIP